MVDSVLSQEELKAFIATLPTRRLASAALIRDEQNRLLVVKPNYKKGWTLPGGTVEAGESPKLGCFREVREEVGLDLEPGRVVLINHALGQELWGDSTNYFYDGGVIASDTEITLQDAELEEYRWVAEEEFSTYFDEGSAARLSSAYRALEDGSVVEVSPDLA